MIRHRVEVYNSQTSPLIAFYADEGILVGIDATGPVEEITSRGLAALGPYRRGVGSRGLGRVFAGSPSEHRRETLPCAPLFPAG